MFPFYFLDVYFGYVLAIHAVAVYGKAVLGNVKKVGRPADAVQVGHFKVAIGLLGHFGGVGYQKGVHAVVLVKFYYFNELLGGKLAFVIMGRHGVFDAVPGVQNQSVNAVAQHQAAGLF